MKKIIALSCGWKNGNCETYIRAAAKGAKEFGVETEIIRAVDLKVLPCRGCMACSVKGQRAHTGKCVIKDDVQWILEKTILSDAALILAVPVFHLRPTGLFICINDRMHPLMFNHTDILQHKKVGGIISHGGSPNDWACLSLPLLNIWTQHFIRLVDQVHIGGGEPSNPAERAEELGRNVARAMMKPLDEVKYVGPKSAITCPVCHCDIVQISESSPHVVCPVCWIHGEMTLTNGKMKIKWDEWETKYPRFSELGVFEHMGLGKGEKMRFASSRTRAANQEEQEKMMEAMMSKRKEMTEKYGAYGTLIKPE